MTNTPASPDDEPVIGAATPGFQTERIDTLAIGGGDYTVPAGRPRPPSARPMPQPLPDELPDQGYQDEYYDDEPPTRNPWFYAFLAAVAVIGAAIVFVFVRSIDLGGDDADPTATALPAALQAILVSPRDGDRVDAGQSVEFVVRVASSAAIAKVELLIDDKVVAEGKAVEATGATPVASPEIARLYDATLKTTLTARGDHTAVVRVTAGQTTASTSTIRLVVREAPTDPRVTARVVATASVRSGPGDQWPEITRLQPGTEVRLVARTRDSEWLQVEDPSGERWIRRNAVSESGSLSSLPIKDTTATPPTSTPTPQATPTPSASTLPDLSPTDARFVFSDRGRAALRVSIKNDGADFSGPVVIEAATTPGGLVVSPLVFDINLRSGRVATVDFEVQGKLPDRADVTVRVDPGNAVRESNEDNNTVGFTGVRAPADPPELVITSARLSDGQIIVSVKNLGGALQPSEVAVVVEVGTAHTETSRVVSLETDQTAEFTVPVPASGTATVRVLLNGATAATGTVQIPGGPTATPTGSPTVTATPKP